MAIEATKTATTPNLALWTDVNFIAAVHSGWSHKTVYAYAVLKREEIHKTISLEFQKSIVEPFLHATESSFFSWDSDDDLPYEIASGHGYFETVGDRIEVKKTLKKVENLLVHLTLNPPLNDALENAQWLGLVPIIGELCKIAFPNMNVGKSSFVVCRGSERFHKDEALCPLSTSNHSIQESSTELPKIIEHTPSS